jgi:hypothetical protein
MSVRARPAPIRIDDLAEPRFSREVDEMRAAMAAIATEVQLEPDPLMEQAKAETGLDDFGDDRFRDPLDVLCTALRTEAGLGPAGVVNTYAQLLSC